MAKRGVFKTDFGTEPPPSDPEALFRDLKGRSTDIRHLWSHQADILRTYHEKHTKHPDVAVELPTGSGKTLVGLLIAEFRRRQYGERVVYLCPTRQLAKQVGSQAAKYGIAAPVLVGPQRDYPPSDFSKYQLAQAPAITTYSGLFNTNPRIDDPQVILLDDAHAGETYIASMWSVEVSRTANPGLYGALLDLLAPRLPAAFVDSARPDEESPDRRRIVELVPGEGIRSLTSAISDLLNSRLPDGDPASYAWSLIKDHLRACNAFICRDSFLLRPIIPPALTHQPFAHATQRIYMSATLGLGGELERVTGVTKIERIPAPPGWDSRGIGRRFFLVPQMSLPEYDSCVLVAESMKRAGRSLVLAPNQLTVARAREILGKIGVPTLGAGDIEDSIGAFTSKDVVALALSRYDGLDLPDEACRMMAFWGLPGGTNLQERFLLSRLAASSFLRDRMLTRFTQGVGRCTRSDSDFAAVFLYERQLVDFILKKENQRTLHPELQAELEFGMTNSQGKTAEEFTELVHAFLEQDESWEDAEKAIVALRDRKSRQSDPATERLREVVRQEVEYVYALWRDDYEDALAKAKAVSDSLGGDDTKGYRGWWYYLLGDAGLMLHDATGRAELIAGAKENFRRAGACCAAISWLAHMARSAGEAPPAGGDDELAPIAVEAIRERLGGWGLVGRRFEDRMAEVLVDLRSTDHKRFHRGLRSLGLMLGFESDCPDSTAAPDCVWSIGDRLHIVHEAKTEETPEDAIGVNDVRQAASHREWVMAKRACASDGRIVCVIETPRETVDKEALPHVKELRHMAPSRVGALAEKIIGVLRAARAGAGETGEEAILEDLLRRLAEAGLRPRDVADKFSEKRVDGLPAVER